MKGGFSSNFSQEYHLCPFSNAFSNIVIMNYKFYIFPSPDQTDHPIHRTTLLFHKCRRGKPRHHHRGVLSWTSWFIHGYLEYAESRWCWRPFYKYIFEEEQQSNWCGTSLFTLWWRKWTSSRNGRSNTCHPPWPRRYPGPLLWRVLCCNLWHNLLCLFVTIWCDLDVNMKEYRNDPVMNLTYHITYFYLYNTPYEKDSQKRVFNPQ